MGQWNDVLDSIRHPQIRALLDHYRSMPCTGPVPAFRDFDPFRFKDSMASMSVWEYDPARRDFTLHLAGEEIRSRLNGGRRGMRLDEAFKPDAADIVRQRCLRCVEEPAIMVNAGPVFLRLGSHRRGERLCVPMADSRHRVTMLLSLTLLDSLGTKQASVGPVAASGGGAAHLEVRFFPLSSCVVPACTPADGAGVHFSRG
jgi:hypothetical protein